MCCIDLLENTTGGDIHCDFNLRKYLVKVLSHSVKDFAFTKAAHQALYIRT